MSDDTISIPTSNEYHTLGPKTFWYLFSKNSLSGFVFLIIALIISIVRSYSGANPDMAGFLRVASWFSFIIAVIGFIVAFVSGKIIYKNTGFMLGEDALFLRHGVFTKEEFAIPYRQIQNIEIERTFSDQMMGISKLIILTAGHESDEQEKKDDPEGIIPSIDSNVALSLQAELLKMANTQKVIQVK